MTLHGKHRPGYRRPTAPLPPRPDLSVLPPVLGIVPHWLMVVGKPGKYRALQDGLQKLGLPAWFPLAISLPRQSPWAEGGHGGPKPGTPLRVISGPFAGYEALCSVSVRDRFPVLMDAARMNLQLDQVEPA
ncbi:hypothetical protein [Ferrovibrio sp.]|uniref:hypothetical protein n=1 Tax=Ferrovibrio sp. TaxID=1917215 RepID=UPI0035B44F2F